VSEPDNKILLLVSDVNSNRNYLSYRRRRECCAIGLVNAACAGSRRHRTNLLVRSGGAHVDAAGRMRHPLLRDSWNHLFN
jgi:hypothetical protein